MMLIFKSMGFSRNSFMHGFGCDTYVFLYSVFNALMFQSGCGISSGSGAATTGAGASHAPNRPQGGWGSASESPVISTRPDFAENHNW